MAKRGGGNIERRRRFSSAIRRSEDIKAMRISEERIPGRCGEKTLVGRTKGRDLWQEFRDNSVTPLAMIKFNLGFLTAVFI